MDQGDERSLPRLGDEPPAILCLLPAAELPLAVFGPHRHSRAERRP